MQFPLSLPVFPTPLSSLLPVNPTLDLATPAQAACAAECEQQRSVCIKQCLAEFDVLRMDVRLGLVRYSCFP